VWLVVAPLRANYLSRIAHPIKGFCSMTSKTTYEAPKLKVLGTLHELTLAGCVDKKFGPSDGHTLQGVAIQCASA
jgi:hypothetical protein